MERDPLVQLEYQLLMISFFAKKNKELIVSLLKDVLDGQKIVKRFVRRFAKQHFLLLIKTLRRAQREKMIIEAPMIFLLTHIIGGVGLTNLAPIVLRKVGVNKVFEVALGVAVKKIESDEILKLRVQVVINGLRLIESK
jgi:hypothetical protein